MIDKDILDLVTILIAIITASILYQQHKVNRDNLRLALFDKRHRIFRAYMDYVSLILQEGCPTHEKLLEWWSSTRDSVFLFDGRVEEYFDKVYHDSIGMMRIERALKSVNDANTETRLEEKKQLYCEWFQKQIVESRKVFAKYLKFAR